MMTSTKPMAARRQAACVTRSRAATQQRRSTIVRRAQSGPGGGGMEDMKKAAEALKGLDLGNMGKLMENARKAQQQVQQEAMQVQAEMAVTEFEGFDEDETVRAVLTGDQRPTAVELTDAAMQKSPEELGKAITEAYQDAHTKSSVALKERMRELANKLGLP